VKRSEICRTGTVIALLTVLVSAMLSFVFMLHAE